MVDVHVQLNLGLGAAGSHAYEVPALHGEVEHVAFRIGQLSNPAGRRVGTGSPEDVQHLLHLYAADPGGRVVADASHHLAHQLQAVCAGHGGAMHLFQIVAVRLINAVHHVGKGFPLRLVIGRRLGDEEAGVHTVLVAHEGGA